MPQLTPPKTCTHTSRPHLRHMVSVHLQLYHKPPEIGTILAGEEVLGILISAFIPGVPVAPVLNTAATHILEVTLPRLFALLVLGPGTTEKQEICLYYIPDAPNHCEYKNTNKRKVKSVKHTTNPPLRFNSVASRYTVEE